MIYYLKKKAIALIHKVFITTQKNSKIYSSSCKSRSDVRGGGKKPWKQKGTGKARAGSIRSSLWVGGGKAFGPKPKLIQKKINQKEKKLSIMLCLKLKEKQTTFIENYPKDLTKLKVFEKIKNVIKYLKIKNTKEDSYLIISDNLAIGFFKALKNIKNITVTNSYCLNLKCVLKANHIIITNDSKISIKNLYGKIYT